MDIPHLYVVPLSPDMDTGREAMSGKEVIPSANEREGTTHFSPERKIKTMADRSEHKHY
jgi:hypothetical protein